MAAIARALDAMGMKYSLSMVIWWQLDRVAENQQTGMASLRSSGQIDQAADASISLWPKGDEQTDPTRAEVRMDVPKNRDGYTINGSREYALVLNKPIFTFGDIDPTRTEVFGSL